MSKKNIMMLLLVFPMVMGLLSGCGEKNRAATDSADNSPTSEISLDKAGSSQVIPNNAVYMKSSGEKIIGNGKASFPDAPETGDVYEEGDYKYTYNRQEIYGTEWSVVAKDKTIVSYGEILSVVADKPVTNMAYAFNGCSQMISAPEIPNGIMNMQSAFSECQKLTVMPKIPDNVTDMSYAFKNCSSLTTASVIPKNIENLKCSFFGCSSLTGTIEVNTDTTDFFDCFNGTTKPITLVGSSGKLTGLASTASNYNITVPLK